MWSDRDFRVVSLLDRGTQAEPLEALGAGVDALRIDGPSGLLALPLGLARIVRAWAPDVIQGWMYHGNLAATLACRLGAANARLYWGIRQTLYSMSNERPLTRLVIRANAALAHGPQAVIFNSRVSAEQHAAAGFRPKRTLVIPNGFDLAQLHLDEDARRAARERLGIDDATPVIGLVARHHPMKDHVTFLRAAARVVAQIPTASFVLAGRGIEAGNPVLARAIAELGIGARMHLLGELREPQRLYPAFDVAVLSSAWGEAFPNVLGEALACGVPCVATDVGDAAYIVGEAGRIVPPRNDEALAENLLELLGIGAQRRRDLGAVGRHRVERLFSLQAVAEQYRALYCGELG
jgi:glycosyltransferase involved in cell wall biosynthesis